MTATTLFQYDRLGRQTSVTDPLGRVTKTDYIPATGEVWRTEPDPDGSGPQTAGVTKLTYDEVGNLISLLDASGNQTLFGYDFLNRLVTEQDPLGKNRQYQYDVVGNLTSSIDRNHRRRDFQYDNLDRVTSEVWRGPTAGSAAIHSIGNVYDDAGRLASVSDQEYSYAAKPEYAFSYDHLDRLVGVTDQASTAASLAVWVMPSNAPVVNWTRDYASNGDLATLQVGINGAADALTSYGYDHLGRVTQVAQSGTAATGQPVITPIGSFFYHYGDLP